MQGLSFIGLFIIEFILLFFLSRSLSNSIANFFYSLTKSKKLTIYILAFIFLPGTIIHELSHFLSAGLLFVHVGEIEFMPILNGDQVKLGSVEIGKTGILKRMLIGLAPVFIGLSLIIGLLWFFKDGIITTSSLWQTLLILYAVFEIGNTMFSSSKDLEGALTFFGTLLIVFLTFVITLFLTHNSISFQLEILNSSVFVELLKKADLFLSVPIFIDAFIVGITRILVKSTLK